MMRFFVGSSIIDDPQRLNLHSATFTPNVCNDARITLTFV